MKITFYGAARTTTGSMHLVEIAGKRILLDCGLYQGRRKEAFERNRHFPFPPGAIDTVLLSHAHIDHSGNLPTLVNGGFRGRIVATEATCDLCDIMLRDSAYLQVKDVEYINKARIKQGKHPFEPLYEPNDIDAVKKQLRGVPYETPLEIAPGATATYHDAGHILGSALITIDVASNGATRPRRLLFTGDLGRAMMPILRDPTVVNEVDWLITESTYGNRVHPPKEDVVGRLKGFIEDIQMQRAKLIIPAFSVGRTQNVVYLLRELYESGRVRGVPVYVDSPLSSAATAVYSKHTECYDTETAEMLAQGKDPFHFPQLRYITNVEDSKKLNDTPGPAVIIAASGMCEGGRILHHLRHSVGNPRNIILFIGYQAENTLGRRLVEHVSPVKILGESYDVEARIHTINALSAHADRNELLDYFKRMGPRVERAFMVHGEKQQIEALASGLHDLGAQDVVIPEAGQPVEL